MGMSADDQEDLRKNHLLFGEPNSEQLVSGGFHHEWPDARGVFFNHDRDVLAWVNQELAVTRDASPVTGVTPSSAGCHP